MDIKTQLRVAGVSKLQHIISISMLQHSKRRQVKKYEYNILLTNHLDSIRPKFSRQLNSNIYHESKHNISFYYKTGCRVLINKDVKDKDIDKDNLLET